MAGECVGDFFCVKYLHLRLSALKMEMHRLLNSLDKLGYFCPRELGQSCKDYGDGILGPVSLSGIVGRVSGPSSCGETDMDLVFNPNSNPEGVVGLGSPSFGSVLYVDRARVVCNVEGLELTGHSTRS